MSERNSPYKPMFLANQSSKYYNPGNGNWESLNEDHKQDMNVYSVIQSFFVNACMFIKEYSTKFLTPNHSGKVKISIDSQQEQDLFMAFSLFSILITIVSILFLLSVIYVKTTPANATNILNIMNYAYIVKVGAFILFYIHDLGKLFTPIPSLGSFTIYHLNIIDLIMVVVLHMTLWEYKRLALLSSQSRKTGFDHSNLELNETKIFLDSLCLCVFIPLTGLFNSITMSFLGILVAGILRILITFSYFSRKKEHQLLTVDHSKNKLESPFEIFNYMADIIAGGANNLNSGVFRPPHRNGNNLTFTRIF